MKFSLLALLALVLADPVVLADPLPECTLYVNPVVAADLKCTCDVNLPMSCMTITSKAILEAYEKTLYPKLKKYAQDGTSP